MLNILMVGANDAPGGVAGYINSIVNNLDSKRFTIHLVVADLRPSGSYLSPLIVRHQVIQRSGYLNTLFSVLLLRKIIKNVRPDILHLHTARGGFMGVVASLGFGIPVIYTGHTWRFEQLRGFLKRYSVLLCEMMIARIASVVTLLTLRELEVGKSVGLIKGNKGKIINTRIAVPVGKNKKNNLSTTNIDYCSGDKWPIIGTVGELCLRKNPDLFLKIAKEFIISFPNAVFIWVGGGDLAEEMQRRVKELGLGGYVVFTGALMRDDVISLINCFDVFLFTSSCEGVPLALLEAKLLKIPVIAASYPGVEAIVRHDFDGFVFNGQAPQEAADLLGVILKNEDMRQDFASRGYEYALDNHTPPKLMAEEYSTIYNSFVD